MKYSEYIPKNIEAKWQKIWHDKAIYKVDLKALKNNYYLLIELPYASGDLHMGHWFTFGVSDILARFKKMNGFSVFMPVGFDAFGLPAENAAIKRGIHPQDWTYSNIAKMKSQFATMGTIGDLDHGVITADPQFYKWNQWIFLKMYEKSLVYRGKSFSNWCPQDQTVLANENVENGLCWRCGTQVVQKEVEQWFLKITSFAERLLWKNPPQADWPKPLIEGQNNWIGKSRGIEINFQIANSSLNIKTFTTYPETIFGVTFMILAPEHPLALKISTAKYKKIISEYIKKAQSKSELDRLVRDKSKSGVFTGAYCINPVNSKKIPVWVADYVLSSYGTGAVMGVPGSDKRDFEFAKKFGIEIIKVIAKNKADQARIEKIGDVLEDGYIVNSGQFNGLVAPDPAKNKFADYLLKKNIGTRRTYYHLRDWSISRQRYWGTPIPIIYCDSCGIQPVPIHHLPVLLPRKVDYTPKGKAPLATAETWLKVKCPKCEKTGCRETETMDTFVDSSWYFLRYLDPKNNKQIFKSDIVKKWMPLDLYVGGAEHTLGHTLYSRFFVKFLNDLGLISFEEYAKKRIHHGVILGPDNARMSKSRGNVVNPDEQVQKYGADAVRMYLAFLGPYDLTIAWNPAGIRGIHKFLYRVWRLVTNVKIQPPNIKIADESERIMNKTIKKVTEDIEGIKFNTAISALMEWMNALEKRVVGSSERVVGSQKQQKLQTTNYKLITRVEVETLLLLLAPFAPHMTEELWQIVNSSELVVGSKTKTTNYKLPAKRTTNWSIHNAPWPKFNPKLAQDKQTVLMVEVNGKVRDKITIDRGISQSIAQQLALKSERVIKNLQNKKIKRVIFVPEKLINFVV